MYSVKKKLKFRYGKDANKMLLRKLIRNFIVRGKITTTRKKAKFLKSNLERILIYAKKNSPATQNRIKNVIANKSIEKILNNQVVPVFKEKTSGFTTIKYLPKRESDSSYMAKVEWSVPVVLEKEEKKADKVLLTQETKTKRAKTTESPRKLNK